MIRAIAVVLAILLVPALTEAQQLQSEERMHTVESGETLSAIAGEYYGDASEWRRIYEANRDRIVDPGSISVGMNLVIPGDVAAGAAPARVTDVQVAGSQAPAQDLVSHEERRGLLEAGRFEPASVPPVAEGERTVFFDVPDPAMEATLVVTQPPELIPAVPPGVFQAAGWLIPFETMDEPLGVIAGFSAEEIVGPGRTAVHFHENVRLRFDAQGAPRLDDEFLVYEVSRTIEELGRVATPTGRVRVVQVGEDEAVAQVVEAFAQIRIGQPLARLRTFPLDVGVHPAETEDGAEGRTLAFQSAKELHLPGEFAFIDIGSDAGLAVGDELIGLAEGEEDWARRELARFQVVGVQDEHATVRIAQVRTPGEVRPGLRVVVVRQMP